MKPMHIPTMTGVIDRRILINFRVEKSLIESFLPYPFRPKTVDNYAIVGICLIRLRHIRPKGFPEWIGIASENAAHRIAVEWTDADGLLQEGVFVPRRDTSLWLNSLAGGRVFPGVHYRSDFQVHEQNGSYDVRFAHTDGTHLHIQAQETVGWSANSVFENLAEASAFFQAGSVGYSPCRTCDVYDGLELKTAHWSVLPLAVSHVASSFFANPDVFPAGAVQFDNALLMRAIPHEWTSRKQIDVRQKQK